MTRGPDGLPDDYRPSPAPVARTRGAEEGLADLGDEELLAEVWRRFGENWCSFSSGVRARDVCPCCDEITELTRHHLVPVAQGAGRNRTVKARYVKLCRPCHALAHRTWGPGHRYDGPPDREIFLARLRAVREG